MDPEEQMRQCASQIQLLNTEGSYGALVVLLRDLEGPEVPLDLLQATDTVTVLYCVLKTCSDARVKKQIKGILSKWKKRYRQSSWDDGLSPSGGSVADQSPLGEASDPELGSSQAGPRPGRPRGGEGGEGQGGSHPGRPRGGEGGEGQGGSHAEGKPLAPVTDPPPPPRPEETPAVPTPDRTPGRLPDIRRRCLQLLLAALLPLGPPPGRPPEVEDEALAGDVEGHIHALHGASPLKYKACVRSRAANLRREPWLRRGLRDGSLPPRELARMTPEEMAGPDLRRLRREYAERAVSERQLPRPPEGSPTQKVRCGRCGARDCRVSQLSRGALFLPGWVTPGGPDHDAVTFVTCSVCGEQWYHSGWECL